MKTINELTEQEILVLTELDIQKMIKLRMAEDGIKILDIPKEPELLEMEKPDLTTYSISILGDNLCFGSIDDANAVVDSLLKSTSIGMVNYDYSKLDSNFKYFEKGKTRMYYDDNTVSVNTVRCYSMGLYAKIADEAIRNKKAKDDFIKQQSEYNKINSECVDIVSEIRDRVSEVKDKYYRLEELIGKFNNDYLPIANGDEKIAMKFLVKAYSLSEDDVVYINNNYNKTQEL